MFSEMIDKCVTRSTRGTTAREDLLAYARHTMRECLTMNYFDKSLIEDVITTTTDNYVWTHPRRMHNLRTVKYPNEVFPELLKPGKIQRGKVHYYYIGPGYVVFSGTSSGDEVAVAYYMFEPYLLYYDPADRPAVFDRETEEWSYLSGGSYVPTLGSDALDEAARALVYHWTLDFWESTIMEGTLAKLFYKIGHEMYKPTYYLFKQFKDDLRDGEPSTKFDR